MPSLEHNRAAWAEPERWGAAGDDWSEAWGGVEAQWFGSILPRIHRLLPAPTIVEIAPGHGRWTQFLLGSCDHLIGVDLTASCVTACEKRFSADPRASFHVNDGRSLPMVADGSADLVFSFDSLVHAEADVLDAYLVELARVLAPGGAAFLHHSNLAAYRATFARFDRIPRALRAPLEAVGLVDPAHWRAQSVSAALVVQRCVDLGLRCVRQELVSWGSRRLIDCFSLIRRADHASGPTVARNPRFMAEAAAIRAVGQVWGSC